MLHEKDSVLFTCTRYLWMCANVALLCNSFVLIIFWLAGVLFGEACHASKFVCFLSGLDLAILNFVCFLGWLTLLTLQAGPVFAERWNPIWCGSCPWTTGEYLAPGVADPPSLLTAIFVSEVVEQINENVQEVSDILSND